ncbi:MAG: AAA family ATPase [Oscillospiraceae bacterium]|nr:AAA family ATPase [Oscillospiraceae bacterium]MCL2278790.1 AAA family ATPase [Oscillospiraceae bacterium]
MIRNNIGEKSKEELLRDMKPSGSYLGSLAGFSDLLGTIKQAENAAKELLDETAEATAEPRKPRFKQNQEAEAGDASTSARLKATKTEQSTKEQPKEQTKERAIAVAEDNAEAKPSLEELLQNLDSLVGLDKIKQSVKSLINYVKVRKLREENKLPNPPLSLHMVFTGNPGTGKTTVARILSELYCAIGVLTKGQLVEVDRSGLVAGFVGQTAIKTSEAVERALGGILFIDEAYALAPEMGNVSDFGRESIETLLKLMEDNRGDLIVIVAGYSEPMERFIMSNPGLESRFNRYFDFEDYDSDQLNDIFTLMCSQSEYLLTEDAKDFAREHFRRLYENRDENFGNARHVRNFFEHIVSQQSDRISLMSEHTREDLVMVIAEDLENAAKIG